MKSLKHIVNANLRRLVAVMMILVLLIAVMIQFLALQGQAKDNAEAAFAQVGQIIRQNEAELTLVEAEYRETCLLNAEVIAYIIQQHPTLLGNVEEFRQLAYKLEVDEIHIFDTTGRIFTGTHPEYFDFTFDTGEQIGFFKPLLTDRSLRLCQDITPNTAEQKLVQYSALWSPDGKFIVQVGMYPDAVLEATAKNELSYIFSLLQGNPGVSLYAVDSTSRAIIGSTAGHDNGKTLPEIGFDRDQINRYRRGAHVKVNGVNAFCVFHEMDDMLLVYTISCDQLYSNVAGFTLMMLLCLVAIACIMLIGMQRFNDRYIIGSLAALGGKLRAVADGNLDERLDVHSSLEFAELSLHINHMIDSLLASTDKMSLVLDRTNMRIGVYEYNTGSRSVRFTAHMAEIFGLGAAEMADLAADYHRLQAFIRALQETPFGEMPNTYCIAGEDEPERYLRLEEVTSDSDVLGIVMDVTEEIVRLQLVETERDHDLLTGLYNRRYMERYLGDYFAKSDRTTHGAIIAIDTDNLKVVNDTFGHKVGDLYLKQLAALLHGFAAPRRIAIRLGGDEFVLAIGGYPDRRTLDRAIDRLRSLEATAALTLDDGTTLPLRFSFGYAYTHGRRDFDRMQLEADEMMYRNKRARKGGE